MTIAEQQNNPTHSNADVFGSRQQAAAPRDEAAVQQCLQVAKNALEDVKAQEITVLDVRTLTNVTDYVVIANGTSTRHVKALADNVAEEAKKAGFRPLGVEGQRDSDWILIDLANVVVHVMLPTTRKFYDLESLWKTNPPQG